MSNLINNCSLNLVLIQNLLTHHNEATGFTDNIEEIYENVYHPKNITLASTKIHLYSIIENNTQDNMNSPTSVTVAVGISWVTSSITVASQFVTLGTIHTVTTTVVHAVISIITVTFFKYKEMKMKCLLF